MGSYKRDIRASIQVYKLFVAQLKSKGFLLAFKFVCFTVKSRQIHKEITQYCKKRNFFLLISCEYVSQVKKGKKYALIA